ncbi:hypothetical protein D3C75_962640 [compost metagenome]
MRRRRDFIAVVSEHHSGRTVRNGQIGYIIHGLLVDVIQVGNLTGAERIPEVITFALGCVINGAFIKIHTARAFARLFGSHDLVVSRLSCRTGSHVDGVNLNIRVFLFKHRDQRLP